MQLNNANVFFKTATLKGQSHTTNQQKYCNRPKLKVNLSLYGVNGRCKLFYILLYDVPSVPIGLQTQMSGCSPSWIPDKKRNLYSIIGAVIIITCCPHACLPKYTYAYGSSSLCGSFTKFSNDRSVCCKLKERYDKNTKMILQGPILCRKLLLYR